MSEYANRPVKKELIINEDFPSGALFEVVSDAELPRERVMRPLGAVAEQAAHDEPQDARVAAANDRSLGEPIIPQSPTHRVGDTVYMSVPGPVVRIKAPSRKSEE